MTLRRVRSWPKFSPGKHEHNRPLKRTPEVSSMYMLFWRPVDMHASRHGDAVSPRVWSSAHSKLPQTSAPLESSRRDHLNKLVLGKICITCMAIVSSSDNYCRYTDKESMASSVHGRVGTVCRYSINRTAQAVQQYFYVDSIFLSCTEQRDCARGR